MRVDPPINRKGADVLFVAPSGDLLAEPGIFTLMGYLMVLHQSGLNYTWSTYASEGGNFGMFASHELMKRLNAKIYAEARRLGRQVDPRRRVRAHVARRAPVHGDHERARRLP